MEEHDLPVSGDDDVGALLERVVAVVEARALAAEQGSYSGHDHTWAEDPQWGRPVRAKRPIEGSIGVGDHERVGERQLGAPGRGTVGVLRGDDDEARAGRVDFRCGLRDPAEVGAIDVSAGVPGEIRDGRVAAERVVRDRVTVGRQERESREGLHLDTVPRRPVPPRSAAVAPPKAHRRKSGAASPIVARLDARSHHSIGGGCIRVIRGADQS